MKVKNFSRELMRAIVVSLVSLVAVMGFSVNAQQIGTIGVGEIAFTGAQKTNIARADVISALRKNLNQALVDTRKFTVLGYSDLESRIQKQGLELQGFYDKKYTEEARSQVGLDYILTANIVELGTFSKQRAGSAENIGLVDVDFRLIGVADLTEDIASSANAQTVLRLANTDSSNSADLISGTMDLAVDRMVDQITTALHPIRVMIIDKENASITLNYGQGMLSKGDTILVYPEEQDIKLGVDEASLGSPIATLQITNVDQKFARAQALEGFEKLEKGQKGKLLRNDS